ncbi:SpoIIE family protein phosphatase [Actinacidiphila oryziradicis]|uniref:PPM-type phosphatase domain-containing protein n=1 Tax=Actinacidiphila oryziradicis TaxID=2571141 RepID=A0A4U0RUE1_9ACTN|nr:SpoIIE family protein phosphatase [Actinacidiphila oryziradicis]TJZ99122.1 hypothetical protein FCI23_47095 [Actinacidiphila oryziradicis]
MAYFLGDVCGKGAETTAGTSLIRCTVRVAAQYHSNPVDVLAALNSALLLDSSIGSRYCPISVGADLADSRLVELLAPDLDDPLLAG